MKWNYTAACLGVIFSMSVIGRADITRVATFENFTAEQKFKPSFFDPLSGITFSNSTGPTNDFVIGNGLSEFGFGNYHGSAGTGPGQAFQFGFTASLSNPSDQIAINVTYPGFGDTTHILLEGFDSRNNLVDEQSGPANSPDPFMLTVNSPQFNMTSFKIVATNIFTGYDNISYTINAPEPSSDLSMLGLACSQYADPRKFSKNDP